MHLMYFNESSYLKRSIGQAQLLPDDYKRRVRAGTVLAIESYEQWQGHYKVKLSPEQAAKLDTEKITWYVWQPAVKIVGVVPRKK